MTKNYITDLVEALEDIVERWSSPVHCCLRAGIDVAFSHSAGVVGFVIRDLKKMYPEGIPD